MFVGAATAGVAARAGVEGLDAFAQSDGVGDEGDESFGGEVGGDAVIFGLAKGGVAGGEQHGGVAVGGVWAVQISRYQKTGKAFEDHFFESIGGVFQLAGDARVQRAVVFGQSADQVKDGGAHLTLAPLRGGPGLGQVRFGFDSLAAGRATRGEYLRESVVENDS